MPHTMVELIHILSCIRTKKLLCFLYRQLILGNILKSLLKLLAMNLLMLKQMELNWKKEFILLLHLLLLSFVIIMMHLAILCFVDMKLFQMLLCLAQCIMLSITFCRRLIMGWSRGRLQFKKGRMMRTSLHRMRTRWSPTRFQLGLRFLLGFQKQSAPKTTPWPHTESVWGGLYMVGNIIS